MTADREKMTEDNTDIKKVPGVTSCRVQIALLCFLGINCMLLMRGSLSVAIVCMTHDVFDNSTNSSMDQHPGLDLSNCPHGGDTGHSPDGTGEFEWSRQLRGNILSSFYVGYMFTQFLGGWLSNRFGAKWVLWSGMVVSTVATLLTPVLTRTSVYLLIVLRVIEGLGQGVFMPALHTLLALWSPALERSKLSSVTLSGFALGSVLTFSCSGLLCEHGFDGGWPSIFYVYGIVCTLWCILWVFLVYNSPADHPRITAEERNYIEKSLGLHHRKTDTDQKMNRNVPWTKLVTSPPVLATITCHLAFAWGYNTTQLALPQYMEDVLRFDIQENGLYNALPFVCQWFVVVAGSYVADNLRKRNTFSTTTVRKGCQSLGFMVPVIFVIAIGFLDCHQWALAVVFLCIAVAFLGCSNIGVMVTVMEVAPRYAGIISGISHTVAAFTGVVSPLVVGALTPHGSQQEWRVVFFITGGIFLVGNLVFVIFGSGEVQSWALDPSDDDIKISIPRRKVHPLAAVDGYNNTTFTEEIVENDKDREENVKINNNVILLQQ